MRVLAAVLAAGEGKRWDGSGHKLMASFRGKPVVGWAIENAVASELEVIVVYGALDCSSISWHRGARSIENADWAKGQSCSLALVCAVASEEGFDAVVVGLGDQPLLQPSAWVSVAEAPEDFEIVVASYDGLRGHPIRLNASTWPLLNRGDGDEGARGLIRKRPELVREVACEGNPADIDTLEELHRWS